MGSIKMLSMDSHYWTFSGLTCVFSLDHYPHGRDPVFFLTCITYCMHPYSVFICRNRCGSSI